MAGNNNTNTNSNTKPDAPWTRWWQANADDRWWRRRLFITFASKELSGEDLRDMQRTNSLDGFKMVRRDALLLGLT